MSVLDLTQTNLNESLRGLTNVDIMMFLPDKNISFPSNAVTLNATALSYTNNLQSLLEFSSLPQANIATFENNSWILDGTFVAPLGNYGNGSGDSYTGYISNEMTDDNGDYSTNPILGVTLLLPAPQIKYLSIKFAGGIDTSYPKTFKIRTYGDTGSQINEHVFNMSEQTGLPLLMVEINDENVKSLEFEFVGTVCPHRRSRLNKIMFGKAEQVDPYYLQSWKVDDKASLVADSIPTKTFEYSIINYNGDYNIDNPGNRIPDNYKDVLILFTLSMETDELWKYAPTKTFNLTDISTTPDGIVTFTCGSLLDILTETYDNDIYLGPKTLKEVMDALLAFSGIGTDQYIIQDNIFEGYEINIPIPESPVREIIQRLAFSCGATLTVNDDNKIVFSKKDINTSSSTPKFMFHQPDPFNSAGVLLEEPNVEALENTTNIAMTTYETEASKEDAELGSASVSVKTQTRVTFSPAYGDIRVEIEGDNKYHAEARIISASSQHAIITVNWDDEATLPINVKIKGRKAETTQKIPIGTNTVTVNTLLLDSGIARTEPTNLSEYVPNAQDKRDTFYYTDWYGAKFKYKCKTRNEYLVKAGDIILFETPFSDGSPIRRGYVLRNTYSDGDSGEMEVIRLDKER